MERVRKPAVREAGGQKPLPDAGTSSPRADSGSFDPMFCALAGTLPDAVAVLSDAGEIRFWGGAGRQIFGYADEEAVGQPFFDLLVPDSEKETALQCWRDLMGRDAAPGSARSVRSQFRHANDGERPVELTFSNAALDGGSGAICIIHDLTEHWIRESAHQRGMKYLDDAESIGHTGHWRWVIDQKLVQWSDEVYRIHGFGDKRFDVSVDEAIGFYHPEDRAIVQRHLDEAIRDKSGFEFEARLLPPDGRLREVWARGRCELDADGEVIALFGVFHDITDRKEADRSHVETITAISQTIEKRDPYTAGHERRVASLCVALGVELGLTAEQLTGLRFGAQIHDIGKIWIPAEILVRPGRLTREEYDLIKTHPGVGAEILDGVHFPWPIEKMVHQHHERLDRSGYPNGLSGDDICVEARIIGVADVVEAMGSHRPYRPALGIDAGLVEVLAGSGTKYDPKIVTACVDLFRHKGFSFDAS